MNRSYLKRLFALLLVAAAMLTFPSISQTFGTGKSSEKIESFEIVTLRLSGMRFTTEYEVVMKGNEAEVVRYQIRYEKKENKRVPDRKTVCSSDKMLQLLNDCELAAWDEFHGQHPKNVKDGIMFFLKATVNGNRIIKADGSENFPKNFRKFWKGLDVLLSEK